MQHDDLVGRGRRLADSYGFDGVGQPVICWPLTLRPGHPVDERDDRQVVGDVLLDRRQHLVLWPRRRRRGHLRQVRVHRGAVELLVVAARRLGVERAVQPAVVHPVGVDARCSTSG